MASVPIQSTCDTTEEIKKFKADSFLAIVNTLFQIILAPV